MVFTNLKPTNRKAHGKEKSHEQCACDDSNMDRKDCNMGQPLIQAQVGTRQRIQEIANSFYLEFVVVCGRAIAGSFSPNPREGSEQAGYVPS
jgi:hypothetical protein